MPQILPTRNQHCKISFFYFGCWYPKAKSESQGHFGIADYHQHDNLRSSLPHSIFAYAGSGGHQERLGQHEQPQSTMWSPAHTRETTHSPLLPEELTTYQEALGYSSTKPKNKQNQKTVLESEQVEDLTSKLETAGLDSTFLFTSGSSSPILGWAFSPVAQDAVGPAHARLPHWWECELA